jgi:uncharacterized RmlC-like cupin family protein
MAETCHSGLVVSPLGSDHFENAAEVRLNKNGVIMATAKSPTCVVIRGGEPYHGKQDLDYVPGVSARTAGSQGICMLLTTIPPGAAATAHLHRDHETAIYMLSGEVEMRYGQHLEQQLVARAGDFLYIPAGMPHQPANLSQSEPAVAVLARTDPNEQESVILWPDGEVATMRAVINPNGN